MFWVLDKNTNETVAMTSDPKIAEMVAANCGRDCDIKYTEK